MAGGVGWPPRGSLLEAIFDVLNPKRVGTFADFLTPAVELARRRKGRESELGHTPGGQAIHFGGWWKRQGRWAQRSEDAWQVGSGFGQGRTVTPAVGFGQVSGANRKAASAAGRFGLGKQLRQRNGSRTSWRFGAGADSVFTPSSLRVLLASVNGCVRLIGWAQASVWVCEGGLPPYCFRMVGGSSQDGLRSGLVRDGSRVL